MELIDLTEIVYTDKGFINMAEVEYNTANRGNWGKSCRVEGNYYITPNNERYIIKEIAYPTFDMGLLHTMKYGKDYTMADGFIILTDGTKYCIPSLG